MAARIMDRFTGVGRRLTADEKAAVDALHAKYPNVPLVVRPERVVLKKKHGPQAE